MARSALAQDRSVVLAWDRSPDAHAIGYFVYLGTEPGVYSERHDVGSSTSFTFAALSGTPYYFAVAAYTAGGVTGPRSYEVSTAAGATMPVPDASTQEENPSPIEGAQTPETGRTSRSLERLCHDSTQRCLVVTEWARTDGTLDAIAAVPDGRVFAIDSSTQIRVATAAGWLRPPALVAERPDESFGSLAVDPNFPTTHYLFASRIRPRADGTRELDIVRYREVANRLGEGATIIAAIPLPARGRAPFAVDGSGRIYIAVPGLDSRREPYAGTVLRFDGDGKVPPGSPALSPILAVNLSEPTSIVWDGGFMRLWLTGKDAASGGMLSHVPLAAVPSDEWPRQAERSALGTKIAPAGIALPATASSQDTYALAVGAALHRRNGDTVTTYSTTSLGEISEIVGAADGIMHVVVQPVDRTGVRLLELKPETR